MGTARNDLLSCVYLDLVKRAGDIFHAILDIETN
jgi:hypothetical protein